MMATKNYEESEPRKRRKTFHRELCAICQTSTEIRVHQATAAGVRTFTEAMRSRRDDVYDRVHDILTDPVSTPQLSWHPICYRTYTSKNNIREMDNHKKSNAEYANSNDVKVQTRSSTPDIDWKLCIICQRKSHKRNFSTCTVETDDTDKRLHTMAERSNDAQLLSRIDNINLRTKCAKYHRGCFSKYMHQGDKMVNDGADDKENVYDEAFRVATESVVDMTMSNKSVCEMTELTKAFREELRVQGVESADSYGVHNLKRRLQKHYHDRISFSRPSQRNKSELVYGSHTEGDIMQLALDNTDIRIQTHKFELGNHSRAPVDSAPLDIARDAHVGNAPVYIARDEPVDNAHDNARDAPVDNAPVDIARDAPVGNAPVDIARDEPVDNAHVDNAPVDIARNASVDNVPVDNVPVDNAPVDNTSIGNAPVDDAPDVPHVITEKGDALNVCHVGESNNNASQTLAIYHAAQIIKNDISASVGIKIQPLDPADLSTEKTESIIPDSLQHLLKSIICINDDCVTDVDKRRILSIAQDIMNASSHARIKTPKHIGLGITMKHLTGSKDVVTILNRMGHSSCYQEVQEADTSLAKEVMARSEESGVVVPSNIVPGKFVQAAADNIDFSERTIDGQQTTHATSIVLYQERGQLTDVRKTPACTHSNRQRTLGKRVMTDTTIKYNATAKRPCVTEFLEKENASWYDTGNEDMNRIDREWVLLRMLPANIAFDNITLLTLVDIVKSDNKDPQIIPGWSGFNSLLSTEVRVENTTTVGYCPLINAPPTDNETVYNVLKNLQKMMEYIGQQYSVITFDLAIYSRAKEIQWRREDEFRDTTIRLGGFHIALNYLAVIGKVFCDGGLCDILTESRVYGPNATDQLLIGRSYNRGVRAHKIMYEALMRLLWRDFLQNAHDEQDNVAITEDDVGSHLLDWRTCVAGSTDGIDLRFPTSSNAMDVTHRRFNEYINIGIKSSQTFNFWIMYLRMVEILLAYIRAERKGEWKNHLDVVCRMMPYFMAMDRQNYGRWLPVYVAEMRMLPLTCPTVHEELSHAHSIARSTQRFARVWSDQALEQSLNKDTKKKGGGLVGITKKDEAVDRWCLGYHDRALIVESTKSMFGIGDHSSKHRDLSKSTIGRDEQAVRDVVKVFTSGLALNPFETDDQDDDDNPVPLTNIITGTTLPKNIAKGVLNVKETGDEKLQNFVEKRLNTNEVFFWEPLKNSKISTFSTVKQATSTRPNQEKEVPISDRNLLGRLLILSSHRKIRKEEVLSHELTTVPMALAHADGSLRKSTKCDLLTELEKKTDAVPSLPESRDLHTTAVMVDAMALVQSMKTTGLANFGDFAERCTSSILSNFAVRKCTRVDIVFDRYDNEKSIKAGERSRRGKSRSHLEVKIKGPMTPLPKRWNDFLSNPKNKINLIVFLTEQWQRNLDRKLDSEKEVRIAGGRSNPELCVTVTSHGVVENPDLTSNHEEADTRLLLHAQDASRDHHQIVICSPDTDVAILCLHFMPEMHCDLLWFYTGTRDRRRYIPIHALANAIGGGVCRVLPALHAMSGCDSTSAIRSISKKKALSTIDKVGIDKLEHLGDDNPMSEETRSKCESFVCSMYNSGQGIQYTTCDKLRYNTFLHKTQNSENLPPTTDSITQHIKRSNYQSFIWKQSLVSNMDFSNPDGNGWVENNGKLTPKLMTKDPAPRGMVELTVCNCEKSQCQTRCSCKGNGLQCTDACKCSAGNYCKNPTRLTIDTDDESGDDEEL